MQIVNWEASHSPAVISPKRGWIGRHRWKKWKKPQSVEAISIVIYIRVSSGKQIRGLSLRAQKKTCLALARQNGWKIVRIFVEKGKSAKTINRPELQEMWRYIKTNPVNGILFFRLDRLLRSVRDVDWCLEQAKKHGCFLKSATEFVVDTSARHGELFLTLATIFAQMDNEARKEYARMAKRARHEMGRWNGCLHFGYTTLRQEEVKLAALSMLHDDQPDMIGNDAIAHAEDMVARVQAYLDSHRNLSPTSAVPHPDLADEVRNIFVWYASGVPSDNDIAIHLNQAGCTPAGNRRTDLSARFGRMFSADTVRDMLQSRFYLGEIPHRHTGKDGKKNKSRRARRAADSWRPGEHEGLISIALYDKCQAVRQERAAHSNHNGLPNQHSYSVTSIARCGRCQSLLRGQPGGDRLYLRDPASALRKCTQRQIRLDYAEAALARLLAPIRIPDSWQNQIISMANLQHSNRDFVARRREQLEDQRKRLNQMYLKYGRITEDEYDHLSRDLDKKVSDLKIIDGVNLDDVRTLIADFPGMLNRASAGQLKGLYRAFFSEIYLDKCTDGLRVEVVWRGFVADLCGGVLPPSTTIYSTR